MTLVDVLVEGRSYLLPPYIAEETLDPHGLLPLNDRHEVQLEELDDELDPLEIARAEFDVPGRCCLLLFPTVTSAPLILHRVVCILCR